MAAAGTFKSASLVFYLVPAASLWLAAEGDVSLSALMWEPLLLVRITMQSGSLEV